MPLTLQEQVHRLELLLVERDREIERLQGVIAAALGGIKRIEAEVHRLRALLKEAEPPAPRADGQFF